MDKDFDLVVLGEPDYIIKHSAVIYKGKQKDKRVWSIIKGCQYVIHLAYIDWCPNSVVESLICGKAVVHSSCGGTKYVVRNNGIMIKDKEWNFKPIDLYDPPDLDMDEVISAYHRMLSFMTVDSHYLDIDKIADQYIGYCKRILDD